MMNASLEPTTMTVQTTPVVEPRTFMVDEADMPTLQQKFEKLLKRARKLGVEEPRYIEVGRHSEWQRIGDTAEGRHRFWSKTAPAPGAGDYTGDARTILHLQLEGLATIKLAGWSFLATLDHELGEDNTVVRLVPGAEGQLPTDYRHRGNVCDHCRRATLRKATYVVKHEDGRLNQVGSTCIKDFLGHDAGKALSSVELSGLLGELFGAAEEGFGGGGIGQARAFDLVNYLAWVAKSVRENGWVSRATMHATGQTSTADDALSTMLDYAKEKNG